MSYFWNGDNFQTTATPPSPGIDTVQMRNSSSNPNLIQYANDHTNRPRSMPDHVIVSSAHEQHINEIKLREDFCTKADKGQCQLTCLQVSWGGSRVMYQGGQGSVSAYLSTGIMGGGCRVMYQGGQRSVSAYLSTGVRGKSALSELCYQMKG